tara:strand:- start:367 stop:630 length:264 start_codon:yes stop_codon:yes gene_type:complete
MENKNLEDLFNEKSQEVKQLTSCSNDNKLYLYKFYKQAMIGDNNTSKPGFLDFTGKAKWSAWESLKGMSKEEAMQSYINKVNELLGL